MRFLPGESSVTDDEWKKRLSDCYLHYFSEVKGSIKIQRYVSENNGQKAEILLN